MKKNFPHIEYNLLSCYPRIFSLANKIKSVSLSSQTVEIQVNTCICILYLELFRQIKSRKSEKRSEIKNHAYPTIYDSQF